MIGHANLTLTGSAQQFSEIIPANPDRIGRQVWVQADPANANVTYFGATAALASNDYGFVLPAPENGIPHAPFLFGDVNPMPLKELYCRGTNGEVLHFFWII